MGDLVAHATPAELPRRSFRDEGQDLGRLGAGKEKEGAWRVGDPSPLPACGEKVSPGEGRGRGRNKCCAHRGAPFTPNLSLGGRRSWLPLTPSLSPPCWHL